MTRVCGANGACWDVPEQSDSGEALPSGIDSHDGPHVDMRVEEKPPAAAGGSFAPLTPVVFETIFATLGTSLGVTSMFIPCAKSAVSMPSSYAKAGSFAICLATSAAVGTAAGALVPLPLSLAISEDARSSLDAKVLAEFGGVALSGATGAYRNALASIPNCAMLAGSSMVLGPEVSPPAFMACIVGEAAWGAALGVGAGMALLVITQSLIDSENGPQEDQLKTAAP